MSQQSLAQQELSLDCEMNLVPGNVKNAMAENGDSSRDLWQVTIGAVRLIPGFNARIKNQRYFDRVRMLADSMKRDGFKQEHPLAGYIAKEGDKNVVYLYGGHRRFEAVLLSNSERGEDEQIRKVPFVIAPKGTSLEDLTVDLVTGNTNAELAPFEVAVVCKRMVRFQWDVDQIAYRIGITTQYVNDLLLLMASPKVVRDMVQSEQLAATQAIEMLHKHGDKTVEILQRSVESAHAAGKTKVTAKFIPGAKYKKAVMKTAPVMVAALKDVKADPAFASLSAANQEMLGALLDQLAEAEKDDGGLLGAANDLEASE